MHVINCENECHELTQNPLDRSQKEYDHLTPVHGFSSKLVLTLTVLVTTIDALQHFETG